MIGDYWCPEGQEGEMRMDDKYHGYCIGGPYARQHKVHWSNKLIAPVLHDVSPSFADYNPSMDRVVVDRVEYQHVQHFYVTEGEGETVLNFWVPATEKHPRKFVLEELLRSYVNGGENA